MRPPDTIAAQAKKMFDEQEGPLHFENALFRCLSRGVVHKIHDNFLMAEKITVENGKDLVWDADGAPNCWFIWYATKALNNYMSFAERPLPYIAWKRRGKIKIHTWERGEKYGWR